VKIAPSYSDIFHGDFDNSSLCTTSDEKRNTKRSENAEKFPQKNYLAKPTDGQARPKCRGCAAHVAMFASLSSIHGRSTQAPCDSSFANDSSPAITVLIHTSFVFLLIATALAPTVGFVSAGAISDIENNPTKPYSLFCATS
jgi:hypothetical protein